PALQRAAVRTAERAPFAVNRGELREDLLVEPGEPSLTAAVPGCDRSDGAARSPAANAMRDPGCALAKVIWRSPPTTPLVEPSAIAARTRCIFPWSPAMKVTLALSGDQIGPGVIVGVGRSTAPRSYRSVRRRSSPPCAGT